jgi:hypothetical protein
MYNPGRSKMWEVGVMSIPALSSITDALGSRTSIPFRPVVPQVESPSHTLRIPRPSSAQILGIVIYIAISGAGIFVALHYLL